MNAQPHTHDLRIAQLGNRTTYVDYGDTTIFIHGQRRLKQRIKKACIKAKRKHDKGSVRAVNLYGVATEMQKNLPGWCE